VEQPTTAALQQIARDVFGRELNPDEIEAYRGRLSVIVDAIRLRHVFTPASSFVDHPDWLSTPSLL
jgi:hypothetical protein